MTDIEARLREAYDAEHLPDEVRSRTLAAIERVRKVEDAPLEKSAPFCADALRVNASEQGAPRFGASSPARRRKPHRVFLPLAACLVLALALVGVFGSYQMPAAFVAISVNPSIELTVNPWGTVIGAQGLNEDGETVIAEVALDNLSYEEAIDRLVTSPAFSPYLTSDALVDVDIKSDDSRLGDDIAEQTDRVLAKAPCRHRCHRADGTTCGEGHGAGSGQGGGHHGWRHRAKSAIGVAPGTAAPGFFSNYPLRPSAAWRNIPPRA